MYKFNTYFGNQQINHTIVKEPASTNIDIAKKKLKLNDMFNVKGNKKENIKKSKKKKK